MKEKNKKLLLLGGIVLLIILIVGTFLLFGKKSDAIKFKEEYESLNGITKENGQKIRSIDIAKDNPFIYQSASQIVDRINNKETFIVYFGFPDCPWCRSVLPTLIDISKNQSIDVIYYVDVKNLRDVKTVNDKQEIETTKDSGEGYNDLLKALNNVLADYILKDKDGNDIKTGEKRIYAPNVVVVKRGEAVGLETGISSKQENGYMDLTDEMKEETYNKFKEILKKLNSDEGVCTNETGC